MIENLKNARMWLLLFLTLIIAAGVIIPESFRDDDFSRYDAPFYTVVSQNIARSYDWANLRGFSGKLFVGDHPPLIFWATAINLNLFGESAFSSAFFSIICGIGTCLVVFFIGTLLLNDIAGFLSGTGLLLTRYLVRVARHNTIEIPLTFFVALAVLFLILAQKKHRSFYILFGISTGMAVLAKGVVGFFPFGIAFFFILAQKRWKDFFNPYFIIAVLFPFLMGALWFFITGQMTIRGAIANFELYSNFVLCTFRAAGRPDPGTRLRFITRLFEFCFIITPGIILGLFYTIKDNMQKKGRALLVLPIWAFLFIIAFLLSSWRRGFYLLPMYPALAVLFGIGLTRIIPEKFRMYSVWLFVVFFLGNITAPYLFPHWEPKSIGAVVFQNTHFPRAREAVRAIYEQAETKPRLVAYKQRDENEFIYFFSSDFDAEICESAEDFDNLVESDDTVVFYIPKREFSRLDKEYHKKLKIVYAFNKELLVTNKSEIVPVFEEKDR